MYNKKHLAILLRQDRPAHRHAHPKEMDLNGLYSALRLEREGELRVKVWLVPLRLVRSSPTRGCGARIPWKETGSSARSLAATQPASVGLEPTPPESKERLGQPRTPIGDPSTMNANTNQDERQLRPARSSTRSHELNQQEPTNFSLSRAARDLSYPSPSRGWSVCSEVTRLLIGRLHRAIR